MLKTVEPIVISEENARPRIYEVGVLFVAGLGDDGVMAQHTALMDWVTSHGGEVIFDGGMPERFDLAYPMPQIRENKKSNHTEAYLGWFKFTLDSSLVREFEDMLARDINIIRKMVFKTVKENTYIQRKSPRRRDPAYVVEDSLIEEAIAAVPGGDPIDAEVSQREHAPEGEVNETELAKKLEELSVAE